MASHLPRLHRLPAALCMIGISACSSLAPTNSEDPTTDSRQGVRYSLSSESEPLIGWGEIISGNEQAIENWLPFQSIITERPPYLHQPIQQVVFEGSGALLPQPVRIIPAVPTSKLKVVEAVDPPTEFDNEPQPEPLTVAEQAPEPVSANMSKWKYSVEQAAGELAAGELAAGELAIAEPDSIAATVPTAAFAAAKEIPEPLVAPTPPVLVEANADQAAPESTTGAPPAAVRQWQARTTPLIDPELCGVESYRLSDQGHATTGGSHHGNQCETCQDPSHRHSGVRNIRSRMQLARDRFRKTLLGDSSLFNERPLGSSLNAVMHAQAVRGAQAQCAVWEYDFERNHDGSPTAKIKSSSLERMKLIAEFMLETGHPVTIQSSGLQELDQRRSAAVISQLARMGVAADSSAINISSSKRHYQSGIEADLQFRNRITQGVRGNTAGGNSGQAPSTLPGTN